MALPPTLVEIPLGEAVEHYLQLRRRKAPIRRLSPATARTYTVDLHRFLELLPAAGEHTTESVTGAHVDEVLLAYAHTTVTTTLKDLDELPGELSVTVHAHPLTPGDPSECAAP